VNLDTRWCDLSTRDYLIVERAWGWTTGVASSAIIAGGALIWRFFHRRRQRRLHDAPPAPMAAVYSDPNLKPCPCCFTPVQAELADYYAEVLERASTDHRKVNAFKYPP
jgi:hypothetical protein